MEDSLAAFLASRRDASLGGDGAPRPGRSADRKVTDAEQAFERAMAGSGGVGFTRTDADVINKVGAIDALQKSSTVAERLAALKSQRRPA